MELRGTRVTDTTRKRALKHVMLNRRAAPRWRDICMSVAQDLSIVWLGEGFANFFPL